jgi:hypothetical protein
MLPLIIGGGIALAGAAIKAISGFRAAKKSKKMAQGLKDQGNAMESEAWTNKTDYKSPEEIASLNLLAQANLNDNSVENAMKSNADLGASNTLSRVSRAATSANDAAAMAAAAEQQRIAGYNQAAIAGAQERNADMNFLAQTTQMISNEADKEYNANVLLPFRLRYAKSQQLQQAGIQGEVDSINQNAAAWASIGSGLMDAGGVVMGMPIGGGGSVKTGKRVKAPTGMPATEVNPGAGSPEGYTGRV